jgi:Uma2 family endonuclease
MSAQPDGSARPSTPWELAHLRPLTIADLPEDEVGRTELIDGSLYVTPAADLEHHDLVGLWWIRLRELAPVPLPASPGGNVILNDATLVVPDVMVYDPEHRVRDGLGVSPEGLALVVEITSPSTRTRDLTIKRDLYDRWGVPYIVVDRGTTPYTAKAFGSLPAWVPEAGWPRLTYRN